MCGEENYSKLNYCNLIDPSNLSFDNNYMTLALNIVCGGNITKKLKEFFFLKVLLISFEIVNKAERTLRECSRLRNRKSPCFHKTDFLNDIRS